MMPVCDMESNNFKKRTTLLTIVKQIQLELLSSKENVSLRIWGCISDDSIIFSSGESGALSNIKKFGAKTRSVSYGDCRDISDLNCSKIRLTCETKNVEFHHHSLWNCHSLDNNCSRSDEKILSITSKTEDRMEEKEEKNFVSKRLKYGCCRGHHRCMKTRKTNNLHYNNKGHQCQCRICFNSLFSSIAYFYFFNGSLFEEVFVESKVEKNEFCDILSIFTHVDISIIVCLGGGGGGPSPETLMFRTSTHIEREVTVFSFNSPMVIISLIQLLHAQQLLANIRFRMTLFLLTHYMRFLTHALEGPSIVSPSYPIARASLVYITSQLSNSFRKMMRNFMMHCVYYTCRKQDLMPYTKKESINFACKTVTLCEENTNELQYLNVPTKLYEKLNGHCSLDIESQLLLCKKSKKKENPFSQKEFESTFSEETFQILFQHVDVRPGSVEIQAYPASQPVLEPILKKFSNSQSKPTRHDTMAVEFLRLCTMHDYPNSNGPSLLRLAEAGFYFEGEGNTLVCFSCNVKRGNWEYSDSPKEVHRRISPNCPFLNSGDGNVPVPRESRRDLVPVERHGADIVADGMSNLAVDGAPTAAYASNNVAHLASSSSNNYSSAASLNEVDSVQRPTKKVILVKHPEYANRSTRLSSYANFPRHMKQHPADMTEAGFYYAGFGDCCRCFHCGIGLRNWDPEDNPWIEHARWSAECPYILRIKGQAFIDLVQEAARAAEMREDGVNGETNGSSEDASSSNEAANFIKDDKSESTCSDNATSPSGAMASSESSGGNNVVSTSEAVITSGDSGYGSGGKIDASGGLRSEIKPIKVPLRTEAAQSLIHEEKFKPKAVNEAIQVLVEKEGWSSFSKESIRKYIKPEDKKDLSTANADPETLKQENKELKDLTMCKICLDEKVSIVFLPCGHLVACPQCAPALTKCPICRKGIKGTVRTNLVDKQSV